MPRKKTPAARAPAPASHSPASHSLAGPSPAHVRVRRNNAEDAERMREKIVAAALRLFSEGGVDAVSMRAVAAEVGVSPMAPYRYFTDKAELLSGLWQDILADVYGVLKAAVAPLRDPRERERAANRALLTYWETHDDERRLVYLTQGTPQRDMIVPVYREVLEFFRQLAADLARQIGADEGNAAFATEVRMTMTLGYFGALHNRRFPWSEGKRLREVYIDLIVAAVEHCLRNGDGQGRKAGPAPRATPRPTPGARRAVRAHR